MKYCSRCGHELVDEAIMCVGCGCMVEGVPQKKKEKKKGVAGDPLAKPKSLVITNFIFSVIAMAWIFFIVLSFLEGYAVVYADIAETYGVAIDLYAPLFYPIWSSHLLFVFSCILLIVGILSFVFTLVKKMFKLEYIFSAVIHAFAGVLVFFVSLPLFIYSFY